MTEHQTSTEPPTYTGTDLEGRGVGVRFVALFVDWIILGIVFWGMAFTMGDVESGGGEFNIALNGLPGLLYFVIAIGLTIGLEATKGATLGKMALGLKVVKTDGSPIGWGAAIGRNLMRIIDGFAFYLVGAITVWSTDKNQRLGDMVAKTLVVSK